MTGNNLPFTPPTAMQLPLAHLDPSAIEEVPVSLWGTVFDAVGWPTSLTTRKDSFSHDDVGNALVQDELSDDLLLAIEALNELGTEAGREAIVTAMKDRRVVAGALPANVGERSLALHLFLAQRSDAALVEVFARAQAQVQEAGDTRRYNEFMGKAARVVSSLASRQDALLNATKRYCRDQDLGEHVHVHAFEDDGAYVFRVIRSHHIKEPLAVVPGREARATLKFRPVHGDILRYDATVGRLRIAARAASIVEFYRRALGQVLFGDELFFTDDPVCSLRVMQEKGRAAIEQHNISGIGRVWMTECLWERGDRDLLQIRSRDCFRNIEELRLPLTEGELVLAKLKLEIVGRSTRPTTVSIRVPSRIEVSNKAHEDLVDRYLSAVRIRNAQPRSESINLWTLYPWRHPAAVWRAVFGGALDGLVERGVLIPIQLASVPSPDHPGAGHVLAAVETPGGTYGVSQMPELPSRSLTATDLDGLELHPEELRVHLRGLLALTGSSTPWDGHELMDLGVLELGDQRFRLTYALRPPPVGTGAWMRERAAGVTQVLLSPTHPDDGFELARVVLSCALPTIGEVRRKVVYACGVAGSVPAVFTAPERARLVVDTNFGKIWVDGVEITGIRAGTHPFRLVEMLARACPRPVSTESLTVELSGTAREKKDGDTTARQAKAAARRSIATAMAAAGLSFDEDPFPSVPTASYKCSLLAHVA